jgi:catechol 2,3-dioxygenase-like lactoylglutathione lyase family enzyme
MLGQFHEISISTTDIRASVEFYERLGFTQCRTGDTWPHPYGVLTDGRVFLGLHEYRFPSPSITCVRADIARHAPDYTARGISLAFAKTADDCFNEIGFRDPSGQMITILEARTYFPTDRPRGKLSNCGYFLEFSFPCTDFDAVARFWEGLGYVALEVEDAPYLHRPLTGNGLSLAVHRPRTLDRPMLVFGDADMAARIAALEALDVARDAELPPGLDPARNALYVAPEGTPLLLLTRED